MFDRARQIAVDYDRDRAALPPDLSIEEYAAWWISVRGDTYNKEEPCEKPLS